MSEVVSRDAIGHSLETNPSPAKAVEQIVEANLASRRFDVAPGNTIYEPTTPARSLYLLHDGQVRIMLLTPSGSERSVRLLEILGPGDWFGAPALAGDTNYETRAQAHTAVTVSEVPVDRFFAALPQQPALGSTIIRALAGKLQKAYTEAANLVFDDTNRRLIKTLLEFSRSSAATPQSPESGAGIELRITHQQLAQKIGAARETVSLALTQLRQKNLLRTGRNRLSFNPEALESFANSQNEAVSAETKEAEHRSE